MIILMCYLPIVSLLSLALAKWASRKTNIGFWWAFFFSFTLTPVAAYGLAILTGVKSEPIVYSFFTQTAIIMISFLLLPFGTMLILAGLSAGLIASYILYSIGAGLAASAVFGLRLALLNKADDDISW